jgi:hypothetical protein
MERPRCVRHESEPLASVQGGAVASSPALRSLADLVGSRITRVRRVHYVYRGVPDTDFGPLELTFWQPVRPVRQRWRWRTLRVRATAWEDPFAEPLSAENRAFVEKSGKWAAFDVSAVGLSRRSLVMCSQVPSLSSASQATRPG